MTNKLGLPDRYKLLYKRGAGGMGIVYKARDTLLDKPVAIKILTGSGQESIPVQRFQREAKALGKLSHKGLVTVLDFGMSQSGNPYLVMDFVEGVSLQDYLEQTGRLNLQSFLDLFINLSKAMEHSHENGVIHRDLKPSNVVLFISEGKINEVKIIDFGIALLPDEVDFKLTRPNALLGSPFYMSPEQINSGHADERSDIYSLGCLMYECLTGAPPYKSDTAMNTMNMHVSSNIPSLNDNQNDVIYSDQIDSLVQKTLQKDPDKRFQSMNSLAYALENLVESPNENAEANIEETDLSPKKNLKSIPLFGVICVGVVLIAGMVFSLILVPEQKENNTDSGTAVPVGKYSSNSFRSKFETGALDRTPVEKDELPKIFERVNNNHKLDLRGRVVSRKILQLLSTKKFKILDLRGGALEDNRDIKLLTNCGITKIVLNSPDFDDVCAYEIAKFPNLVIVEANDSSITDKGIEYLTKLKGLYRIELDRTKITDEALKKLSTCADLDLLQLSYCQGITDTGIGYLKSLKKLKTLDVRGCKKVSAVSVLSLQRKLPKLKNIKGVERGLLTLDVKENEWIKLKEDGLLELKGYNATDAGLEKAKLNGVKILTVYGVPEFTGSGFKSLKNTELIRIKVDSQNLNDEALLYISKLSTVKELYVRYSSRVTEKGFGYIGKMNQLTRLSFRSTKLPPNALKHISKMNNLAFLDLGYTNPVLDENLRVISSMSNLDDLCLSGTKITDSQLAIISKMNITKLNLHCTDVTGNGLMNLSGLKNLRRLKLSADRNIDKIQLNEFQKQNPNVSLDCGLDKNLDHVYLPPINR